MFNWLLAHNTLTLHTVVILAVGMLIRKLPSPWSEALGLVAAAWFLRKWIDPRSCRDTFAISDALLLHNGGKGGDGKAITAKLAEPSALLGNTGLRPVLTRDACPPGDRKTYRVRCAGNPCVYLGAMRNHPAEGMVLEKGIGYNEVHGSYENLWCFLPNNRKTYLAGTRLSEGRAAGPGTFEVPFTLDVTVDAGAGTLAVAVVDGKGKDWKGSTKSYGETTDWSGRDLGMVIQGMKTDAPIHLAVGTNNDACQMTLL